MRDLECGQITVFLSLLLMSFFLIISVCIEGIYVQVKRADFVQEQLLMGEYALANYQKELLEQFHIFAMDPRYVSKMESHFGHIWEQNSVSKLEKNQILNSESLVQENPENLKQQIWEYMKYRESTQIVQQLQNSLQGMESDSKRKKLKKNWDSLEEVEKKEVPSEEAVGELKEDPRKSLQSLLKGDITSLVLPKGRKVSEKKIKISYGKKNTQISQKMNFYKKESVSKLFGQTTKTVKSGKITKEVSTILYVDDCFHNALETERKDGITYEMEYLIAGKESEKENLEMVIQEILLLRFLSNYAYLMTDVKKQEEVYALALAITNVGSVVPGVTQLTKMLLLAAWAYGESVVDVKDLLAGNKIPFYKNNSNWKLRLSNLGSLKAEKKKTEKGNAYQDYLNILLLSKRNSNEKYLRMMDVMEARIKETQKDFCIKDCIYSFELDTGVSVPSLLYGQSYQMEQSHVFAY